MKKLLSCLIIMLIAVASLGLYGCSNSNQNKSENLTHYDIVAEYDDSSCEVNATMNVNYINNTGDSLSYLCFNMYANAYNESNQNTLVLYSDKPKTYTFGDSFGGIKIESVVVNGENADFEVLNDEQNVLKVPLQNSLSSNDKANICVMFTVKLANIKHRIGKNNKTINLGNWFPILCVYENGDFYYCDYNLNGDPFYSEVANYTLTFTAPEKYTVVGSSESKRQGNTHYFKQNNLRDFALVLYEDVNLKSKRISNTMVTYYYYDDIAANENFKLLVDSFNFFNSKFGAYPYSSFSACQTQFAQGGMEYPALVYISDGVKGKEYGEVIVHELAHNWWYGAVGSNQIEQPFLDEGLTEYSVGLFYEHKGKPISAFIDVQYKSIENYRLALEKYNKKMDMKLNRPLSEYRTVADYVYTTYVKGSIMFDEYRKVVGDDAFFGGIREYYKMYKFKNTNFDGMVTAFAKTTRVDVSQYLMQYINKTFEK